MAFPDPRVALARRKCTIYGATRADLVYVFLIKSTDSGFAEALCCDITGYNLRPFFTPPAPRFRSRQTLILNPSSRSPWQPAAAIGGATRSRDILSSESRGSIHPGHPSRPS